MRGCPISDLRSRKRVGRSEVSRKRAEAQESNLGAGQHERSTCPSDCDNTVLVKVGGLVASNPVIFGSNGYDR
jgi:hypothetical protein